VTDASPRRLWIFNHYAALPDDGAGTRHFDLARELVRDGWSVTIFASSYSHFTRRDSRLFGWHAVGSEVRDGVRFVWVRTPSYAGNGMRRGAGMLAYSALASFTQRRFESPTHVIGSTVHPFAAAVGLLIARARGARYFFEIRDLWPQSLVDLGAMSEHGVMTRVLAWIERELAERADGVITLLPSVEAYFAERHIHPRSVALIPNGVAIGLGEAGRTGRSAAQISDGIQSEKRDGRFVAAYAGTHGLANGLDVVLDAALVLQERSEDHVRIWLIGDGPEKRRLHDRVRAEHLRNVVMAGPVPKADIHGVLGAVDTGIIHLSPSPIYRYGISPNKLFDYMASGRPVIFGCDSSNDPVQSAQCGLTVEPNHPEGLANAILAMSRLSESERDAMGQRGHAYVVKHHDIRRLAAKLAAVLTA
jgi:glycosyltransferase involved in cell wall biosynthesis